MINSFLLYHTIILNELKPKLSDISENGYTFFARIYAFRDHFCTQLILIGILNNINKIISYVFVVKTFERHIIEVLIVYRQR